MHGLTQQELADYLGTSQIGFWKLELENGKILRMYGDHRMQSLVGVPDGLSPEECYDFFQRHVHPEDVPRLAEHCTSMLSGEAEIIYRYNHPAMGEIQIRCGGRKIREQGATVTIVGYHREFSDVIRMEEDKQRENHLLSRNRELTREQHQADDYHKMLMDMTACGIVSYTLPERRVLYMNAEALRIYGADDVEAARENMWDLLRQTVYPDKSALQRLVSLREENGAVDYTCEISNLKGYKTSLLAHSEVITTPKGERAVFTTFLDISENTELKKERNILDALCTDYIAVYLLDLTRDSIVPFTEATKKDDAYGQRRLGEKIHSFSARMQFAYNELLVKESDPDFLRKMNADYLMKYLSANRRFALRCRMKPNPGGHEWFEIQVVRVHSADGFQVVMGFRYIDDVLREEEQKKKALEDALAAANQRSEIITAISRQYWQVFEVDLKTDTYHEMFTQGKFTTGITDYSGLARIDFGKVMNSYIDAAYLPQMREFLNLNTLPARLAESETVFAEFIAKLGFWASARFLALSRDDSGTVTKVLFILKIIDEQKRRELDYQERLKEAAEEAKQANEAKTIFLRRMSHDIRTPINGIIGMLKIAERHTDDAEKIWDCTEKALSASRQLLALVNDVLDISKLEANEIIVENKPFDLVPFLLGQISAAEAYAAQRGIAILGGRSISTFTHRYLIGSDAMLGRVLMNLAGNAVKYNRPGGSVTLTCTELSDNRKTALFRFICEDTGIGMSEEFQKRAFEPYAREGRDSSASFTGTGLGLSIVKKIVEQMGGTVRLESKVNKGSKFTVEVPIEIDWGAAERVKTVAENKLELSGKKALLAEDNELNREIAEALFEELGLTVVSTKDGKEAVSCFAASEPGGFSYIFMDVMMPVMDGLEATRAIRALNRPDAKTVPILAISANAFQDDIQRSLEAGMNIHLTKPLEIEKVRQALEQLTLAEGPKQSAL